MKSKFLTIFLCCLLVFGQQNSWAQVDCSTPQGVLALMLAPTVVSGTERDVDNLGGTALVCRMESKIFKQAQPAGANVDACLSKVSVFIYYSKTQANLSNLPNLASTNDNFNTPANVGKITASRTSRNGNDLKYEATIPRTGNGISLAAGETVYYRWAKRIAKEGDLDPYVWSSTFSFVVTALPAPPPPPAPRPDLIATGIDKPLFCKDGGNVTDGTFTFHALNQNFCSSLPQGNFTQSGALPANFGNASGTPILKLSLNLPDIRFGIRNSGNASTGVGYQAQVFKGSTVMATQNLPVLLQGNSTFITLTGRGNADIFRFPGFDGSDARFCYVRQELNNSFPANLEPNGYSIKIDNGGANGAGVVNESNENNNSKSFNCGTSVITVGN